MQKISFAGLPKGLCVPAPAMEINYNTILKMDIPVLKDGILVKKRKN